MPTGLAKNMTPVPLPPPSSLLSLDAFHDWYPGQDQVFARLLEWLTNDERRFMCASLPTGAGKSLLAALCASISGKRTVVLTATKGLQDQFVKDFYDVGFRDIRGQNSYPCIFFMPQSSVGSAPTIRISVDQGPCHAGMYCEHRGVISQQALAGEGASCLYYSELNKAVKSRLVVTNYSYWLSQSRTGKGLGRPGLLVMDEADQAFGSIESFLTTHLSASECTIAGVDLPQDKPPLGTPMSDATLKRVYERVSNLLTLANDPAAYPNEAEVAAAKADEILNKYNTTLESLRDHYQDSNQPVPTTWLDWKKWAHHGLRKANLVELMLRESVQVMELLDRVKYRSEILAVTEHCIQVQTTIRKLETIRGALGQWLWETTAGGRGGGGYGFTFTPVWPGKYSELVFGGTPKILIMSATLAPKTADLLGIPPESCNWLNAGSTYDEVRTPIQHVKTIRVDHKASEADMRMWVSRIDQILDRRTDRKGIILPVSYDRCRFLVQHSRHADRMVSHEPRGVQEAVAKWRATSPPSILVSPAVARGWDFPDDECRYILIGKIPFSDGRTPVAKARNADDPEFAGFEAMQTVVQEAGRGTRSPADWCEVFILDDHWGWFWSKNNKHAPEYFRKRLRRRADVIPAPLEVKAV